MKVLKFGGSSVASLELIDKVAKNIKQKLNDEKKLVVVASAMGKTTNELISKIKSSSNLISAREMDQLLSTGEMQSVSLIANKLLDLGVKAKSLAGWQAGILTNGNHTDAEITKIETEKLQKELKSSDVLVVAGFQGVNNGEITTLGRGGSDTTAVALAAALNCPCEIYTDVDGVYSVDPRLVPNAQKFKSLTYDQMISMSSAGAKVLEKRCSELAKKFGVDLYIGKSLEESKSGTVVGAKHAKSQSRAVYSIAVQKNLGILQVLAHSQPQKMQIDEILSSLKCEPIKTKQIGRHSITSAYYDVSNEENIKNTLKFYHKKLNAGFAKVSLIGDNSKKKQALLSLNKKCLKNILPGTIKFGDEFISFAIPEDSDLKVVKNLADEFKI